MTYGRIWWKEKSGNQGHGDWLPLKLAQRVAAIYRNEAPKGRLVHVEERQGDELETARG